MCIVTEFLPEGSLKTALKKGAVSTLVKLKIARDVAQGVIFSHSFIYSFRPVIPSSSTVWLIPNILQHASNIGHFDIKPGNVSVINYSFLH